MGVNHGGNEDNEGGDKNSGGENSGPWKNSDGGENEDEGKGKGKGKNEGAELMLALSSVTAYRLDGLASWCTSFFLVPKIVAKMGAAGEHG